MLESSFKTINTETGEIKNLFSRPEEDVWFFRMSPDNTRLIFFSFIPPGRVTVSYLCNLSTLELREVSMNDFAAAWSRTSSRFLLQMRDYYGEFFPWFYHNLPLYELGNTQTGQIYAKGVDFGSNPFSEKDKWFALILFNPSIFYNVKNMARDIFVKDTSSRLITRVTLGEKAFSANWL
jgi:hypothetical protein